MVAKVEIRKKIRHFSSILFLIQIQELILMNHIIQMNLEQEDRAKNAILCVVFIACCGGVLLLELLIFWFSCLRENQAFWTNAGGYSEGFRATVQTFYYPLLGFNFLLLSILSLAYVARLKPPLTMIAMQSCALGLCWSLFFGSAAISWANNLLNFVEGKPIHTHPGRPQIIRTVR